MNTGRYGYGKHIDDESLGGIKSDRVKEKKDIPSPVKLFAREFKRLMCQNRFGKAFDLICEASECKVISETYRDYVIRTCIPGFRGYV